MAEEKKTKKPRTAKKAGAGTPLPVETATDVGVQFETAQFIAGTETKVAKKPAKAKKTTVKTEEKAEAQTQEKPKKSWKDWRHFCRNKMKFLHLHLAKMKVIC